MEQEEMEGNAQDERTESLTWSKYDFFLACETKFDLLSFLKTGEIS